MDKKLNKSEFKSLFQKSQASRKKKKEIQVQIASNKKYEEKQYTHYSDRNGTW